MALPEQINELVSKLHRAKDLKEADLYASEIAKIAPPEELPVLYLVREILGRRAVNLLGAGNQIKEDFLANKAGDDVYLGNTLDAVMSGKQEVGEVMKKHNVDVRAMRLGHLKGDILNKVTYEVENGFFANHNEPAIRKLIAEGGECDLSGELISGRRLDPATVFAYVLKNQSLEAWTDIHVLNLRSVDRVLDYIAKVANKTPHANLLTQHYHEAAQLAVYAVGFISHEEARERELVKENVIQGASLLEGIASKYAEKAGKKEPMTAALTELDGIRKKKQETYVPGILKRQDEIYELAAKAAQSGNHELFEKAKGLYIEFTKTHLSILDEDEESFKISVKDLDASYAGAK